MDIVVKYSIRIAELGDQNVIIEDIDLAVLVEVTGEGGLKGRNIFESDFANAQIGIPDVARLVTARGAVESGARIDRIDQVGIAG